MSIRRVCRRRGCSGATIPTVTETGAEVKKCPTCDGAIRYEVRVKRDGRKHNGGTHSKLGSTKIQGSAMWAEKQLVDRLDAGFTDLSTQTFSDYLDAWLQRKHAGIGEEGGWSPKVFKDNEALLRLHVRPVVGPVPLTKLTSAHLLAVYDRMQTNGKAPKTRTNCHGVMHLALADAVLRKLIPSNPAAEKGVRPQSGRTRDVEAWSVEQIQQFLAGIEGHRFADLFRFYFQSGVRRGEALALTWGDITHNPKTGRSRVWVSRQWKKGEHGWILGSLKTHESRNIGLEPGVSAMLEQNRRADDELVFGHEAGGHLDGDVVSETFTDLVDASGIKPRITLHGTRHSFASVLLSNGADIAQVSKLLGHKKVSMTLDTYRHLMPSEDTAAVDIMEAAFALISIADVVPLQAVNA